MATSRDRAPLLEQRSDVRLQAWILEQVDQERQGGEEHECAEDGQHAWTAYG